MDPPEPPPIPVYVEERLHDGCPATPGFLERLSMRLERVRPAAKDEAGARATVRVERVGGVSHGTLRLEMGAEIVEREADSPSCEEVISALTVMAEIGLDQGMSSLPPEAPSPAPTKVPPPAPTKAPSPAPTIPARLPKPRPVPAKAAPTFGVGTAIELSANDAAIVAPSFFTELALPAPPSPTLRVGVARSFRARFVTPAGNASVRWTELRAAGCVTAVRVRALRFGLASCAHLDVGRQDAVADAPLTHFERQHAWVAAGAGVKLAWRLLPRLSLELEGGLRVPITRTGFHFEESPREVRVYDAPTVIPFGVVSFVAHLR